MLHTNANYFLSLKGGNEGDLSFLETSDDYLPSFSLVEDGKHIKVILKITIIK